MSEHTTHAVVEAFSEDCIEGECDHVDENGLPDDMSACVGFDMDVCVECMVEKGQTNDPAWWEGSLAPWPCEKVPERIVPLMVHGPYPEPPIYKSHSIDQDQAERESR